MFARILVALDGSPRTGDVFLTARGFSEALDAEMVPLRVVYLPEEVALGAKLARADTLTHHLTSVARSELDALRSLDQRIRPAIVRAGTPWRVILEVANAFDVALIVVGSDGGHDRTIGSTAASLMLRSDRSLLVVRRRPLFGPILVAVDTSPSAAGLLATCGRLASVLDVKLHLVRVIEIASPRPQPRFDSAAEYTLRELALLAQEVGAIPVHTIVKRGRPWRGVLAAATECGANCIAVGGAGDEQSLGTEAMRIIERSDCHVLVVRERGER